MAPLDPETAKGGPFITTVVENGVGYLVTAALTWIASRLNVGKKITKLETNVSKELNDFKEAMMAKYTEMESQVASMAQELYGAKGNRGIINSLEQVQADVQALNERSAGMDAKLDILVRRGSM